MGIIYNIINDKKDLTNEEKTRQLKQYFITKLSNIRQLSSTNELDKIQTTMGILFQHLRKDILKILVEILPDNQKSLILSFDFQNIEWNKQIFHIMYSLGLKDLIIWFFFHIPYFHNFTNQFTLQMYRATLLNMLVYAQKQWKSNFNFTESEFVHMCNTSCLMYPITYQNMNNNKIITEYNSLIQQICPWLTYTSPHLGNKLLSRLKDKENIYRVNKRKICFISDSFVVDSCVFRDRIGLIGQLMKQDCFDIYVASFFEKKHVSGDIAKLFLKKINNNYIHLQRNLEVARNTLDTYQFDVIIYPDIGMKLYPYLLSFSRLAPIQINTWGHSETSGIESIDYFISSKYFHPYQKINDETVQDEFSEKIVLMDSLSTYYLPPTKMFNIDVEKFKTKNQLGYPDEINVYGCLQTSYKITKDFEKVLLNILKFDPKSYIILSNAIPYCRTHLIRFKEVFGNYLQRIRWYPALDKFQYLELVNICCVILDPFPFGGCNTSFEAFDLNIPVITLPSQFLSGNFTTGLYKKMGITECIVNNEKEYYQKAIQISNNIKLRNKIVRDIENNKMKIFLEKESVDEWKSFLLRV